MKGDRMADELEELLQKIRRRYETLGPNKMRRESFLAHVRSLGRWENDCSDYPEPLHVEFPTEIAVAYAVCHPECGKAEFIVDGSTQECQFCGGLMLRTAVSQYSFRRVVSE
jgi:hypothetical protein